MPKKKTPPPEGFLPDAWFRTRKKELAAILQRPIGKGDPFSASQALLMDLIPFFERFQDDFLALSKSRAANAIVKHRTTVVTVNIKRIQESLDALHLQSPLPTAGDAESQLRWLVGDAVWGSWQTRVRTLLDVVKYSWSYSTEAREMWVQRLMERAPADVILALRDASDSDTDDDEHLYKVLFDWQKSIDFDKRTASLLQRKPMHPYLVEFTTRWVDELFAALKEAFAAQGNAVPYQQFDLYGMKIVIDDPDIGDAETKMYLRYLDEAYSLMNAKGLGSAWYGTVFVKDKEAALVQHGSDTVGGHYEIRKNIVVIFSRPSKYVVYVMAHELGHRYWFKHMSREQRARFQSFIVETKSKPKKRSMSGKIILDAKTAINAAAEKVLRDLARVPEADWDMRKQAVGDAVADFCNPSASEQAVPAVVEPVGIFVFDNDGRNVLRQPEIRALLETMYTAVEALEEKSLAFNPDDEDPRGDLEGAVEDVRAAAYAYIFAVMAAYNTSEAEKYDAALEVWKETQNGADVSPVSEYGETNIDEAFAEAFAHYVLGKDMTQPQAESFRAVLKSASTLLAEKLLKAARALTRQI